jgi:hypothetical protein
MISFEFCRIETNMHGELIFQDRRNNVNRGVRYLQEAYRLPDLAGFGFLTPEGDAVRAVLDAPVKYMSMAGEFHSRWTTGLRIVHADSVVFHKEEK